jgi:C-terminal processing protease CtpA/Prc
MMDRVVASGARALVVDLRDNGGGVDAGSVLLRRVLPRDTRVEGYRRYVRYRRIPAALDSVLDTWDDGFRDHTADTPETPGPGGLYPLARAGERAGGDTLRATGPRFTGRLVVLVSAVNSSATFQFAEAVRALRLGTLVGTTTGGNRRGINGGEIFFLRLPRSRIAVDLPVIGYFPPGPRPDTGLEPDVRVAPSPDAIAAGRDLEMEAVRRLVAAR